MTKRAPAVDFAVSPAADDPAPTSIPELALLLERLAAAAANHAVREVYLRALRVLHQAQPGRPRRFVERNRRDLCEAEMLFQSGKARSFHHACAIVASKYDGDERKIKSIIERLRLLRRAVK